ncbi:tryptophanyl-tRNA synthetase [Candidatus Carsonella ruddii CS isolate Thao2000]|uniref:tryptophan--tRNA ligase n=1 Tax=Candidatus Carsonella ruddii CS isolate Thao2000 TaxID=1202537 RepID=J7GYV3_CARRU|nr:hypothetical protein [Candidatus Carsonella ruddii]AFP83788.1 tryptophanyl-tRNA synthetase [Candidatus Carsonella ruddii CS isolate Thao2000]
MILLGINSSGLPHFGNFISLIKPSIKKKKKRIFLADLHSLCKSSNFDFLLINKIIITATFISFFKKKIIFYQSNNKNILYFFWLISCFYNKNKIKYFHIVKNKIFISIGKICYPLLMVSDIFSNNNKYIFLGIDQIQHIELINKIIKKVNVYYKKYNKFNFIINNKILYSYDKKKMSKSLKNDIFIYSNYFKLLSFFNKFKFTFKKKKSLLNFFLNIIYNNKIINFFFKNNFYIFKKKISEIIYFIFYKKKLLFFYLLKNIDYIINIINNGNKYFNFINKFNFNFINKFINL